MQTNIISEKILGMISKAINTLIVGIGTVTFIWVLAFLIVAMIGE